jgi:hypothetical protein
MNGEFRWMPQRSKYVLTIHSALDHHFEADPKLLSTEDLWMQLMKEVADFLAERGTDVEVVKLKLKDYADIYLSTPYEQEEQYSEIGGSDDGRSIDASGAHAAGESVSASAASGSESDSSSTPAPVAWINFPQANGPGSSAADVDAGATRGTASSVGEPG